MSDFPGTVQAPATNLSTLDQTQRAVVWPYSAAAAGAVWPAANRAIYTPVMVEEPLMVTQLAVYPTVQSGNLDVGIYSETGKRIVSFGTTPVGVINTVQPVNIADTTLAPGIYFFAMCVDNGTAAFQRASVGNAGYIQALGVQQQAVGVVTLPDPATFANPASAYVPLLQAICMSAVI